MMIFKARIQLIWISDSTDANACLDRHAKANIILPCGIGQRGKTGEKVPNIEQSRSIFKLYHNFFKCDDNKL